MKRFLLTVFLVLLLGTVSYAAPTLINYQGLLTDSLGNPVDSSVEITFAIYDAGTTGNLLWNETEMVTVTRGLYSVTFGDSSPLTLPFDQQYFLGITITGESEMEPRTPLTSVGSAIKAGFAESVSQPITTAMIQDGAVTPNKLAISCNVGEILVMTSIGWGCGPSPH